MCIRDSNFEGDVGKADGGIRIACGRVHVPYNMLYKADEL